MTVGASFSPNDNIVALDVGTRRIGVATANGLVQIARPLTTIINDDSVYESLRKVLADEAATALVIGLPRGLDGQITNQTKIVEEFVQNMKKHVSLPTFWQDEALTSVKAEEELNARKKPYEKGDIDALAATYILEDFLGSHKG